MWVHVAGIDLLYMSPMCACSAAAMAPTHARVSTRGGPRADPRRRMAPSQHCIYSREERFSLSPILNPFWIEYTELSHASHCLLPLRDFTSPLPSCPYAVTVSHTKRGNSLDCQSEIPCPLNALAMNHPTPRSGCILDYITSPPRTKTLRRLALD
jgi:hypothetical protein